MRKTNWTKVGEIGVDAGLCWVGDPCYIIHTDQQKLPEDLGKDWNEFCTKLFAKDQQDHVQYNYSLGHPGLGVVVSTGYGDGMYDVEVRKTEDGRVAEVRVVFIEDEDG